MTKNEKVNLFKNYVQSENSDHWCGYLKGIAIILAFY